MEKCKDKYLLLPIVKKTDFLYTSFGILPNYITLFNSYIITSLLLYNLLNKIYHYVFILLFIRNILDGTDGYIARKYKITSELGGIYDHTSDSFFISSFSFIVIYQLGLDIAINFMITNIIYTTMIVFNFNSDYEWIGKSIVGAGGCYDSYCTITYFFGVLLLIIINNMEFNP